jgi:flavin-dependent dehydrogenase
MTVAATLSLTDAAKECWGALVVGAGPAGSVTARELARLGIRVLLVDRAAFPRWKVCGCCLLQPGLNTLTHLGLGDLTKRLGAIPLTDVRFSVRGVHARVPMTGGVALSREAFDAGLIEAAIAAGVQFLPETSARLQTSRPDFREIALQHLGQLAPTSARIVVAADGLGGQLAAQEPGIGVRIREFSRIGAGCVFEADSGDLQPGTIDLACGRAGYIGLVRLEDNRMCCAAALDLSAIRHAEGPGSAAITVLKEAGVSLPARLAHASWRGTPSLTRSLKRHWADRLFVVGDAAGYVEPFTGEGMAAALASARALAPLAASACEAWCPELGCRWDNTYLRAVKNRQGLAHAMAMVLRRPQLALGIVALVSLCPLLAGPFERRLNDPN